jgi:2-amino-4-hydroxy-6-hydroxymethyldihydropteridine diphosphokinase
VILGIGSNLDAENNIERARVIISKELTLLTESTFVNTEAVDMPGEPDFLNGAFKIETTLGLDELRSYLKEIEGKLGRDPSHKVNESRTIDIDIIVFNAEVVNDDFERYSFVKKAVLELAPELSDQ